MRGFFIANNTATSSLSYYNIILNKMLYRMKIYIFSLSLIFFTIFSIANAQTIEGNDAQQNLDNIGNSTGDKGIVRIFDNRYDGVVGSPFFAEKWLEGTIVLENNRTVGDLKLKYNMFEDELIMLMPKTGSIYVDREKVRSFSLLKDAGEILFFKKYHHPNQSEQSRYFRALCQGKMNLWEHTRVIFEKANFESGYSIDKKYDEFKQYPELYYTSASMSFPVKLKTSSTAFVKIFPEHQDLIREFIKRNMLDLRNPEIIISVFQYYEQL